MKNKYERLSKEEKKKACEQFKESSEVNANIYKKLKRVSIISGFGIFYSIASFILDYFYTKNVWDFVLDGILMIFCVLFILKSLSLKSTLINKFLISKDSKKTSSKRK